MAAHWSRAFGGLDTMSAGARDYFARVAAHPAHADFARLSRASSADIAGGRYDPLGDTIGLYRLPIPRYSGIRLGAYAHIGKAIHETVQGRNADAERSLREVIGVGRLLMDDGPTVIDNLVGAVLVSHGGDALEAFYRATGRAEEAERLEWARSAATRAAERVGAGQLRRFTSGAALAALEASPAIVLDTTVSRGVRWERFMLVSTLTPCLNLHRTVFGPDEDYEEWLEDARASLVVHPREAEFFDLARQGHFLSAGRREPGALGAFLNLSMGGRDEPGSCARMVADMSPGF